MNSQFYKQIKIELNKDLITIYLNQNTFNYYASYEINDVIESYISNLSLNWVFDFSNVTNIDSSALGIISTLIIQLKNSKRKLTIFKAKPEIIEILLVSGLNKFVKLTN